MATRRGSESERIKHLEFIQATISRLGTNSFLVRGWSVTATGALLVVSVQADEWRIAALALLIGFGFWALDSSFLRRERMYRRLYDDTALKDPPVIPLFSMNVQAYRPTTKHRDSFFASSVLLIHLPITVVDVAVAVLLAR